MLQFHYKSFQPAASAEPELSQWRI